MKPTPSNCPRCKTALRHVAGSAHKWVCSTCDFQFVHRKNKRHARPASEQPTSSASRLWLPLLVVPLVVFVLAGILIARMVIHQMRSRSGGVPVAAAPDGVTPSASSSSPSPQQVNEAIDRGVAYLKSGRAGGAFLERADSLVGLTLLECGVPADDPAVQRLARRVRAAARQFPRGATLPDITYDVSIAIWFLDRLGGADDADLIRSLALQLISSQTENGGWDYACPPLNEADAQRLMQMLKAPPPNNPPAPVPPAVRFQPDRPFVFQRGRRDDNSLTQFALIALWKARKHGVPVERSLRMVEKRFRMSQNSDGCWGYDRPGSHPDSMTCAGLLGLAVGRGLGDRSTTQATEMEDPAVTKALVYLAHSVGKKPRVTPAPAPGPVQRLLLGKKPRVKPAPGRNVVQRRLLGMQSLGDLYYLWSLERMAVAWGLSTVAGVDWYAWGSTVLVAAQNDDGSWSDKFPGLVDTCFALLFLERANIVKDLTKQLELIGHIRDASSDEIRKGLATMPREDTPEPEDGQLGEMPDELKPGSTSPTPRPKAP